MNVEIVCVGKLKEKFWREAVEEYAKRLKRFCSFSVTALKEARLPANASPADEENVKNTEGRYILDALRDTACVIALDLRGKDYDSEQFSRLLQERMGEGTSHFTFVIGGSLGLSKEVLKRADYRISFSKMTFPHQLMRVILAEQIYRGFKIMRGEAYHK